MSEATSQIEVKTMGPHPRRFIWCSAILGPFLASFICIMLFNGASLGELLRHPNWFNFRNAFGVPTAFSLILGGFALPTSCFFMWRLSKKLPQFKQFPSGHFVSAAMTGGFFFGLLFLVGLTVFFELLQPGMSGISVGFEVIVGPIIVGILGAALGFVSGHVCLFLGKLAKWIE